MPSHPTVSSFPRSVTRGARRTLALGGAALTLLAAMAVGASAPASAHDALAATDPADGSTVVAAPARVRLTFTGEVIELGTEVQVVGPAGLPMADGAAVVQGAVVSQPLVADRPAGSYTVQWRATSADGHPTSGELTFTATTAVAPVVAPPVAEPEPTASPTPEPTADAAPVAGSWGPATWALAIGGGAVVAATVGTLWWVRRQR